MNAEQFKEFIDILSSRPEFKELLVLDRGQEVILVRTTTKCNFEFKEGKWTELSDDQALRLGSSYWFKQETIDMIKG